MDVNIQSALITSSATILASIITAVWQHRAAKDESRKGS